jgi:hypothetical protein
MLVSSYIAMFCVYVTVDISKSLLVRIYTLIVNFVNITFHLVSVYGV